MDSLDDVGAGEGEQVVVALQVVRVAGEPRAPEIRLLEVCALDHRAHGAVEHGDARFEEPPQGGEGAGFAWGGHGRDGMMSCEEPIKQRIQEALASIISINPYLLI